MKRVVIPELLDAGSGTSAEIATALTDLRHINQWFGGIAATQLLVEQVARQFGVSFLSLLEVAAGGGFVPLAVSNNLHFMGIELRVTLLDRDFSHLKNGSTNGTAAVAGDAVALPFADESFDLVSCCLFTHHLEPAQVVQFVNEALRVCRVAVIINDVVRDPIHLVLVYLSLPLYRSHFTRHDAPASVRRGYTIEEMRHMLRQSTAATIEVKRHPLFRMGAIAWKKQNHTT
jgi:ubiquinone/menaquinone biosynthesis C-methylase UbiE